MADDVNKRLDEPELTFEQQQHATEILEKYRTNPSNSNKFRYELFAYINNVIADEVRRARVDELERLDNERSAGFILPHTNTGEYITDRLTELTGHDAHHIFSDVKE